MRSGLTILTIFMFSLALALVYLVAAPALAEFSPNLLDAYLEREFDWAMYVDIRNLDHYLKYKGSRLHPLTRGRVYFNSYIHPRRPGVSTQQSQVYQDLWYHQGQPLGLRRRSALNIEKGTTGTIVISQYADENGQAKCAANAIVRLLVELQLKDIVVGTVIVPQDKYKDIVGALEHYGFRIQPQAAGGKQLSICLRSHPHEKEEYLFLQQ